jgi:hypothetical protein
VKLYHRINAAAAEAILAEEFLGGGYQIEDEASSWADCGCSRFHFNVHAFGARKGTARWSPSTSLRTWSRRASGSKGPATS